eukprot:scaffold266331_cov16-Prasinocladus_malaysianus.AAC.1
MYLCVAKATPSEADSRESAMEAEASLNKSSLKTTHCTWLYGWTSRPRWLGQEGKKEKGAAAAKLVASQSACMLAQKPEWNAVGPMATGNCGNQTYGPC